MAKNGVVSAEGRLTDWVSLGVLAGFVPRDAVDDAVAAAGKQARRSDGKLPPHVVMYLVMALALFADDDYEEAAARLTGTLAAWGCWDEAWSVPTSGGITQARQRLGSEPMKELFAELAVPVAGELTRGAFLGPWRLMSVDGFEWDAPDTAENAAAFGYSGKGPGDPDCPAFPKARVVSISECGSHAVVDAEIGGVAGKNTGEQALARELYKRLEDDWLLIADRNFYGWADWCAAAGSGAALLWRVKADLRLPVLEILPDGSYASALIDPKILVTTITEWTAAPAAMLAAAYHQRWEHESGNRQLKTYLRGPGKVLRSKSPDMVRQEIYGYLLTHYAISALTCRAATEAGIDPDRVKFKRTVRIVRRRAGDPAAFPP